MATSWNPKASSEIRSLVVHGSTVYAGGYFTNIGGKDQNNFAALDAASGLNTSWNPNADNGVVALAVNGTTVYVGGKFKNIGQGIAHAGFAQFENLPSTAIKPAISAKPLTFSLTSNKLNLHYSLTKSEQVSIKLYDIQGKLKYIPLNSQQSAGNHTVTLQHSEITPGTYVAVFRAGVNFHEQKMVILP